MKAIINWFATNSVAANLLMLSIVALGILTAPKLRMEVVPTVEAEIITVTVPYPGAAPEEVEESICARIEDNVQGISGIDEISAAAAENMGSVTIKLLRGADRDKALSDVKSAVDRIDSFPEDAEQPTVSLVDMNPSAMKIMVWGDSDGVTLRRVASDLQTGLSSLKNISKVELKNAPPLEISVEVSEAQLLRYGLTFDEVARALRTGSLDLPGGSVKTEGGEILLRGKGQAYTAADFARIPLRSLADGTSIQVGDVAELHDGFAETDQATRFNGKPAVMIEIFRVGDQDALAMGPEAKAYLEEVREDLPPGLNLSITGDETVMLRERLELLTKNALQGLLLVMITLALFLRFRLALWVTIGIPISFLGAIWLLPGMEVSINMISLFGFIIVLGIVVDDAIVVAENIHHHRTQGLSGIEASKRGAREMSKPVVFAVLTTIAAFLPMLFMPGTMGTFSRNIPLVVIGVLIFSVVESLFVLPTHLKHLPSKEEEEQIQPGLLGVLQGAIDRTLERFISRVYVPNVRFFVSWRYATIAGGIALWVITIQLPTHGYLKFNFFPQIEADNVSVQLTMPQGTPVAVTEAHTLRIENQARELGAELEELEGRPILKSLLTSIGGQPYREKQSAGTGSVGTSYSSANLGEVNLELVSAEERTTTSNEIARLWEARVGTIIGAESLTYSSDLMGGDGDIDLRLAGKNLDELRAIANLIKLDLTDRAGVSGLRDNFSPGKAELRLELLPAGEAAGLTYLDLARQVRQGFYGDEVQRIQRGRDEVKVFVRYTKDERASLETLMDSRIRTPDGRALPFSYVARVEPGRGYSTINRSNRSRTIDIVADIDTEILTASELETVITEEVLPVVLAAHPRVRASFVGPQKERKEFMTTMRSNGVAALLAIFVLLSVPLGSYTKGLAIMSAIPFGLIGAFWGHLIMGYDLSMFSVIGIMALTGVVVNDSLVMIDYIGTLRDEGHSAFEAVTIGARRRFRAILLTTMTTFAGLTPLLLERSMQARFMIPMAVSLAFGVVFATAITLVLVPAFYMVIEDLVTLPERLRSKRGVEATEA